MENNMKISSNIPLRDCLAVLAVIALALMIVFPAASTARSGGKLALCLSNLHLLGRAWMAYQEDNDAWLVGLSTYTGAPYRWVEVPLYTPVYGSTPVASYAECNLTYQLNGVQAGKLFAYTQNVQVYHCPNDKYWLTKSYAPWISYYGSGCMNGEDYTARNGMNITGFRSVTLPSRQAKQLVCVNKYNQIKNPAGRFTFIEEDYADHNQWRCVGSFVTMGSGYWSWWDWPAWYHNGSNTLGFADGHAENHAWQDPRTLDLMRNGSLTDHTVQTDNKDIVYFNNGYVPAGW